ncbi:MAG: hypothetical protein H7039_18295 [Bryobacteraceae bacterium]|nr:hypothetical protein [Bryobacteraceae bacterium]
MKVGIIVFLFACQVMVAAPQLRLSQTAVGPVPVAVNGTATVAVDASNAGDGSLNLQLTSSVPWIVPTTGAARPCFVVSSGCIPVSLEVRPGALAAGIYTGIVTVSDPDAIDAPQTITVTAAVGGSVPPRADFYLPTRGGTQTLSFNAAALLNTTVTTENNVSWLAVNAQGSGSFQFGVVVPFRITASTAGLGAGTYNGQVAVAGSPIPGENRAVPVTMRITDEPIAELSAERLNFRIAAGSPRQVQNLVITNRGAGTLTINGATAAISSGAGWLTAERIPNTDVISVGANPSGLSPGTYTGTVTIASNAVQGNVLVPVSFHVVASGPPQLSFNGVINNGVGEGEFLGQGTIVAAFGEQLVAGEPVQASTLPLGNDLGGVRVFINDQPAPVYYASYNQVNFQVPYDAPTGIVTIRIDRGGVRGNGISARVVRSAPRLLRLGVGDYGIVVNQDGSFPVPPTPGLNSRRARPGDTLVIYAIGLGPTTPAVPSGVASPLEPLARSPGNYRVIFGFAGPFGANSVETTPLFAGLTPNFVGLFQINVTIPANVPRGDTVSVALAGDDGVSNRVTVAIE